MNISFTAKYMQIMPNVDSLHVGDTLWVIYSSPTTFLDTVINQMIDFSNSQNLANYISELKFTGGSIADPGSEYSAVDFKTMLVTGIAARNKFPIEGAYYNLVEENNSYHLKVGLLPDSSGIFAITMSDAAGAYWKNDKCTRHLLPSDF